MYKSIKPLSPAFIHRPQINDAHLHTHSFMSPSGTPKHHGLSLPVSASTALGHPWIPGCRGHRPASLPNYGREKEGRTGGARPREWYLHEKGHQLNQGLFLGAGGKLRDHLDDFVHDAAQVALELLPSLLYKLGILGKQTDRCAQSRLLRLSNNPPEYSK